MDEISSTSTPKASAIVASRKWINTNPHLQRCTSLSSIEFSVGPTWRAPRRTLFLSHVTCRFLSLILRLDGIKSHHSPTSVPGSEAHLFYKCDMWHVTFRGFVRTVLHPKRSLDAAAAQTDTVLLLKINWMYFVNLYKADNKFWFLLCYETHALCFNESCHINCHLVQLLH